MREARNAGLQGQRPLRAREARDGTTFAKSVGMMRARLGSGLTVGGAAALALLTVMCRNDDNTKGKIHPVHADAGATNGASTAGRGGTGMGTGGTGNGIARGEQMGEAGTPTGGSTSAAEGGAPATGGSGPSSGGAGGSSATNGAGGTSLAGRGSSGRGGTAGQGGSAGSGAAGSGASCGDKTGCCQADDPPCFDYCPDGVDFCCDTERGARIPCDPVTEFSAVVCLDSCTGTSFGTGSCDRCVVASDPPCSDAGWDAPCRAGGSATCSDPAAGYRARCSSDGGSAYYATIVCTCAAGTDCTPTPCCSPSSDACESNGCAADLGSCCDEENHVLDICSTLGGRLGVQQFICLNDCTGRSYGTGSCTSCVSPSDPPCDARHDWMSGCSVNGGTTCSEPVAGYRLDCTIEVGENDFKVPNVAVLCTCDSGA
jgi:hypothetical protein